MVQSIEHLKVRHKAVANVELGTTLVRGDSQAGILQARRIVHQDIQHVRSIVEAVRPGIVGVEPHPCVSNSIYGNPAKDGMGRSIPIWDKADPTDSA